MTAKVWDGRPTDPGRSGYHWLQRIDNHGRPLEGDDLDLVVARWEVDRVDPAMLGHWQIADVARHWRYLGPVEQPPIAVLERLNAPTVGCSA